MNNEEKFKLFLLNYDSIYSNASQACIRRYSDDNNYT